MKTTLIESKKMKNKIYKSFFNRRPGSSSQMINSNIIRNFFFNLVYQIIKFRANMKELQKLIICTHQINYIRMLVIIIHFIYFLFSLPHLVPFNILILFSIKIFISFILFLLSHPYRYLIVSHHIY